MCHFFPLNDPQKAADILMKIFEGEYPAEIFKEAFTFVRQSYSAERYREKWISIYEKISGKDLKSWQEFLQKYTGFK
ncbi:MAG: hypothetical protein LC128_10975 [Chitinophagales bacterium]|nr:hypothetical protein [Chitinophagales bacterium]